MLMVTIVLGLLVFCGDVFAGQVITVDDDGPADYSTIKDAIDVAADGDTVIVADGIYTGEGNRDIDFGGKPITVKSENGPENCIIDCQGTETDPHRGFYFHNNEDSNSVLDGITITNGYIGYSGNGGGIYCSHSSPTIRNCVISNSTAGRGGGMYNYGRSGAATVFNCVFSQNLATRNDYGADGGGGMYNFQNCPMLINCIFTGNHAVRSGGAMMNNGSNDDYATLLNCTIVGNSADNGCGGVAQWISNIRTTLTNCILWGNTENGGDIHEGTQISFGSPVINYCCIQGWTGALGGTGNIGDAPLFVDADGADNIIGTADDDLHVQFGSPCIDAGTTIWPDLLPETDLDSNFRQADGDDDGVVDVDMGVYEYGTVETPLISAQPAQIEFIARKNESDVPAQTLFIWNLGIDTLNWQIHEDCLWLDVLPLDGSSSGEFEEVSLSVDVLNMLPGDYNCILTVSDEQADNSPVTVSLTLRIGGVVRHVPDDYPTIQAAVDDSIDGDIVIVADDTYSGPGNRGIDFKGKAITVKSENGPENCIIDCENEARGFYFHNNEDANSVLNGFTITNGYSYDRGGGIYCYRSSPKIINCIICHNLVETWDWFGGGGGMYNKSSNPTINNCIFSENVVNADPREGGYGGGMNNESSSPVITNCTFVHNSIDFRWANEGEGGGIFNVYNSTPVLTNCIFWNNKDESGTIETSQIYSHNNSQPVINYSCVQGWTGDLGGIGNIGDNPLFVSGPLGDYYLSQVAAGQGSDSPCVDAGSEQASALGMSIHTTRTDEIFDSGIVDMGYHYPAWLPVEIEMAPDTLNLSSNGTWIRCYIWLPQDYDVAEVNTDSILLEGQIAPAQVWVKEEEQVVMTKFSRAEVQDTIETGEVELIVSGELFNGAKFEGTDTIRVIDKGGKKK
jgi:hypothetical protein